MKAAAIYRTGSAEELKYIDLPEPRTGPNDIRVKTAAAAVNPVDIKTRSGFLGLDLVFPSILGWDVSGTVEAIGSAVTRFRVGDAVMGMIAQSVREQGTYAEFVSAPEELFAPVPTGLAMEQAAAAPLTVLTAAQLLGSAALPSQARVLVTGAAGAVGRVLVQWLLQDGHEVAGLARSHDREDLTELGAVAVYTSVNDIPACSFDAVLDTAGIADAIFTVQNEGVFMSIADNRQPESQRRITPGKSYVQENGAKLSVIAEQLSNGTLSVPVGRTYSLSEAAAAHREFENGGLRGKVLLIP